MRSGTEKSSVPLVLGGQGRTARSVVSSAEFLTLLGMIGLVLLGVLAWHA